MGVYEIENLINLTLPRQRNLQFLKTAFILNGVQPGEAHVYPIFFIIHGFNTKENPYMGWDPLFFDDNPFPPKRRSLASVSEPRGHRTVRLVFHQNNCKRGLCPRTLEMSA